MLTAVVSEEAYKDSMPFAPMDIALWSSWIFRADMMASPSISWSAEGPRSYPCAFRALRVSSRDLGTFSSAAVPVAPTPGGKPYRRMANFLSYNNDPESS